MKEGIQNVYPPRSFSMPCITKPNLTQEARERMQSAIKRLDSSLAAGTVQVVISGTGAFRFQGWQGREGVSDICAYRKLAAENSPALRHAVARAEALAGRRIDPRAVPAGVHSHDGGSLFNKIHNWASRKLSAGNAEQKEGTRLLEALKIISAYADVLEHGKPIHALSIQFSEADLPFTKEKIRLSIEFLQVALQSPASRAILVKLLPPERAKHVLSTQYEQNLAAILIYLDGFVPFSPNAKQKAAIQEWNEMFKHSDAIIKNREDGKAFLANKDYARAAISLRNAAEEGDAESQFRYSYLCGLGQGVPENHAEAFKWLRKAADQGYVTAYFLLGAYYALGMGVEQDHAQAVQWYRRAADQGYADAQSNLGAMYLDGRGITQDYAEAFKWFRKAADQGFASAQFNLGAMYVNGEGITQDYLQAHRWFNLAASRATNTKGRADAVKERDAIAAKMTPAQIAEAQRLAREWKPK